MARGDLEAIFELYAEDIDYDLTQSGSPFSERVVGHEPIREMWRVWLRNWDDYRAEPLEFVEDGEMVFVRVHVTATSRSLGIPIDAHSADIFTIRDGRIARIASYSDVEVAHRAWNARHLGDG